VASGRSDQIDRDQNYRDDVFARKLAIFIDLGKENTICSISEQFAISEDNFFWPSNFLITSNF
jgi:hypothetical protein